MDTTALMTGELSKYFDQALQEGLTQKTENDVLELIKSTESSFAPTISETSVDIGIGGILRSAFTQALRESEARQDIDFSVTTPEAPAFAPTMR